MSGNRQRGARSGWVRRETKRIWSDCAPAERAEEYLRRAREAENKAATAPDDSRREMLDLAMQWRDLAELALQLAHAEPDDRPASAAAGPG